MGILIRIWRDSISGELSDKKETYMFDSLNLVFDTETRIVYYKFSEKVAVKRIGDKEITGKVGFMSPYIGKHGRYCQFVENQILEML